MKSFSRLSKFPLKIDWLLIIVGLCIWTYFAQVLYVFDAFDRIAYDNAVRLNTQPADERIVVIKIDDHSLNQYGQWPWNRAQHARLLNRIHHQQPAGILMDILFVEPSADLDSDAALSQSLREANNVVLPALLTAKQGALNLEDAQNIEIFEPISIFQSFAKVGYSAVQPDSDNTIRSARLSVHLPTHQFELISARLLNPTPSTTTSASLLIPYVGPMGYHANYSYADVLNDEIPKDALKDKYVLIGATASGLNDLHNTPYGLMPGVEIHANLLDGFLNHRLWLKANPFAQYIGSIVPMILLMLSFLLISERFHLIQLLLGVALLGTMVWVGFRGAQTWFAPTVGMLNLLSAYILWSWRRLSIVVRYLRQQLAHMQDKLPSEVSESLKLRIHEHTMEHTMREIGQLQIRLNTLDQANREMIRFLSHDLRTPQVSILSAMHLFEQKNPHWQESAEYQKLSAQIKNNARQTIDFARDIVELSQVRNNQMQLEEHNLGHLIHFAYEKTYIQAQNKHIRINRQFDEHYEEWAWVYVDGALIERAIINLITNAIRYSPPYSQITLGLTQNPHQVMFTVTDQGAGMDAELVKRLLDPSNHGFKSNIPTTDSHPSQTTQPDAAGGMGIGWRMIHTIVDKHCGSIDIKTQTQMGTTVILNLQKNNHRDSNCSI